MRRRNAAINGPNTSIIRVSEGTSNTSEMILEPSEQAKGTNRTTAAVGARRNSVCILGCHFVQPIFVMESAKDVFCPDLRKPRAIRASGTLRAVADCGLARVSLDQGLREAALDCNALPTPAEFLADAFGSGE
jgi:hypothetical protein